MRILALHSDYIKYEVTKKTKFAEEIDEGLKSNGMEECLTVFTSVEKDDMSDMDAMVLEASDQVRDIARQVKVDSIFIYPYVHLTSNPSSPEFAKEFFPLFEKELSKDFKVKRSPFGYYKAFEVSCKGHPLSELSREIHISKERPEEVVSEALASEEAIRSQWYILTPEGELTAVEDFDFNTHDNLKKFVDYEITGTRAADKEPPHVEIMKRLELVDYEPGSDSGNLRWYPKGALIKRLLEQRVSEVIQAYGGMEVETPIMYDYEHPKLSRYLHRFPARQYTVMSGDNRFFLRFAACFGQYLIKHDMTISYRNLPLKLYELTHFSFRREQKGELSGLRRLRAFTMPDMHTLVEDMDGAKEEFMNQYRECIKWMNDLDVNYEAGIRFVRDFYEQNEDFAKELVRELGRPVLLEMWNERPFYFVMKFEFNFVDAINKASALSTVQIDIENTERFDIKYVDEDGREKYPLMLHASIPGAIERNVYALLEQAYMNSMKGEKPMLPVWLSPTQVRLIPINEEMIPHCQDMACKMPRIRVDIDDRSESLGKRIRGAEKEWVPYIIVVGEKEVETGKLPVRVRATGEQVAMDLDELVCEISSKSEGLPYRGLPLPFFLSKRARFR
ncbi:MAG TPA: threonine--tRNA ligase [Candidatus Methanofastidiosa archaeon]|nr:threonine--tRNA ligase [Candidatus Methanofastidiosa archaeon]